jgi:hypothetical protein
MYTNIRCVYGVFSRKSTVHTATYSAYIRFWPTLKLSDLRFGLPTVLTLALLPAYPSTSTCAYPCTATCAYTCSATCLPLHCYLLTLALLPVLTLAQLPAYPCTATCCDRCKGPYRAVVLPTMCSQTTQQLLPSDYMCTLNTTAPPVCD